MAKVNEVSFSPKHRRLERIATIANIFSWLILVFSILQAVSQYLSFTSQPNYVSIVELLKLFPEEIMDHFLGIFNTVMTGIVFWLILKGVSLGLYMIGETDLNYRERSTGQSHE